MFVFNEKWCIIRKNNSAFCILHYALFIVQQNDKLGFGRLHTKNPQADACGFLCSELALDGAHHNAALEILLHNEVCNDNRSGGDDDQSITDIFQTGLCLLCQGLVGLLR